MSATDQSTVSAGGLPPARLLTAYDALRRLVAAAAEIRPGLTLAVIFLVVLIFASLFPDILAPQDPLATGWLPDELARRDGAKMASGHPGPAKAQSGRPAAARKAASPRGLAGRPAFPRTATRPPREDPLARRAERQRGLARHAERGLHDRQEYLRVP